VVITGLGTVTDWSILPSLLTSPGFWTPILLLAAAVAAVFLARRYFGRYTFVLGGDLLRPTPRPTSSSPPYAKPSPPAGTTWQKPSSTP